MNPYGVAMSTTQLALIVTGAMCGLILVMVRLSGAGGAEISRNLQYTSNQIQWGK